jgi:hypothetical protein
MSGYIRSALLIAIISLASVACATAPLAVAPVVFAGADSVASHVLAPGVRHTFVRDVRGPWAIHIIEIDTRRCEPLLQARKPEGALAERGLTSVLVADAVAGINADFFMLPGGTPVGAHVSDGVTLIGPTDRPVFGVTADGWRIGVAAISGYARARDDSATIAQVNRSSRAFSAYRGTHGGLTLFTHIVGDSVPTDSAAIAVVLRVIAGNEAEGRGIVTRIERGAAISGDPDDAASRGDPDAVGARRDPDAVGARRDPDAAAPRMDPDAVAPGGDVALRITDGTAALLALGEERDWARRRSAGDTVSWQVRTTIGAVLAESVGGFPELLRDGRDVLGEQTVAESFGAARHPRTAIGWTDDGRLLLIVVDGRQPEWSAGMSLAEIAWLFRSLGATSALNLDGGGSTAMVVGGRVVNRPSDREGERAVGNALALTGCRAR